MPSRDILSVFLSLSDAFCQQILDLAVDRAEIIFRPGGDGIIQLWGQPQGHLLFAISHIIFQDICIQNLAQKYGMSRRLHLIHNFTHDVSAGGLVTTLLEMCFANTRGGINFYTDGFKMYGEDNLMLSQKHPYRQHQE